MSALFFTGTQDQALLALVIREAQASQSVKYFGRTALQKVVYFLKALGVPTQYQFEVHHYGPFCDQIGTDIELLTADGVVKDLAASQRYWNYSVGSAEALNELLSNHEGFVNAQAGLVRNVVDVFGGLEPSDLELYATLHYAYRYEMAGKEIPSKDVVITRFRDYKGGKFADSQLSAAYDAMVSARLIKTPTLAR